MKTKGDRLLRGVLVYADECKDKGRRKEVSRFGVQSYR